MPRILIVSATVAEIQPFIDEYGIMIQQVPGLFSSDRPNPELYVVITGTGMVCTAFEMGKLIGMHFDVVINAGLAGSFGPFKIGDVLKVSGDCFAELGAEDKEAFLRIDDLGLGKQGVSPVHTFENIVAKGLPSAKAITVNKVHGRQESIELARKMYNPQLESMEGAAFFYAANAFQWKCIQVRAVSNMVTPRNKSLWDMPLAIKNLNRVLIELTKSI